VLILRPGALGDTLLAVPALRALRAAYGPLTLAAHGGAARLLEHLGEVERGLAFDDTRLAWVYRDQSPPSDEAVVAWVSGPRPPALSGALVYAAGRPSDEMHCARYLLDTLPLAAPFDARPLTLAAVPSDEVLVHPGSGSAAKNWPVAQFAETIRALAAPVRLIVGEADAQAASDVETALGRRLPRLEQPPLDELAARLAGCRAYLGNDSGVSHLAGLCGAPTVVLFGPTSPAVWMPLGPRVQALTFDTKPRSVAARLANVD
jgi:heptosyltransferase-3